MVTEKNTKEATFGKLKVKYREKTEDEIVIYHTFNKDIFYREIPSFKPSEKPIVIDIGAHIGTFSLLTHLKYPQATTFAFEASRETFDLLQLNKKINQIDNMHVFLSAISGSRGEVKLYHSEEIGNWGHSITKSLSDSYEVVEACTLDDVISDHNIPHIDLIKFNCEGAEYDIIKSASKNSIKKIRLGIILYHEDLIEGFANTEELVQLFKEANFRVLNIKKSSSRGWLLVWNMDWYSWSYLAINALMRKLSIK